MPDAQERIEMALSAMASRPRDLKAYLRQPGPDFDVTSPEEVANLLELLLSDDPNSLPRLRFSNALRSWDNAPNGDWTADTPRNTAERRMRIHTLLNLGDDFSQRIDGVLPFYQLEEPVVIAPDHREWYQPKPAIRDYYWTKYKENLLEKRGWNEMSILDLDNSSRAIVECLADPEWREAYASRGLVMGYVQSGKTANFTGVAARAADAGYRLIIILAGTWNILRNQTQRRLDKDLLGKELLANDETYSVSPPSDWAEFLEHGTDPLQLGHYTWQRLTRPDIDFRRLKAAIDSLEFDRHNPAKPIYDPVNLHRLPVKLLVVKKHSGILENLVKDLGLLRTRLVDLPTLIIDDESDQAGLNTVDPQKVLSDPDQDERSKTNLRIVELLQLFPRGQYVGYTATPYANALVNPNDPEDLFPRDFIVSLNRPHGYMGVSDFFDPDSSFSDLDPTDFSEPEVAFIRRVENPQGSDDEELKNALRSYVLSGGIKVFRQLKDPGRYKAEHFKHHTMLIHTSSRVGEQASLATRVKDLWDSCAFNSPDSLQDLRDLWASDFAKVCTKQGNELIPDSFDELIPSMSEAIKRIERGQNIYIVLNSDKGEAPDFSAAPVWKVIIGGNKLSRGYTVEGLTTSYYRRVAGTGDTLMQMGRWFGFRPGYRDLVRVFLGVKEGKRRDVDLVAMFKQVCHMEERFRTEIKRYVRTPGAPRITPRDIPPLISISGNLPPTARNKMFNAVLESKNFGGQWSMLTFAASTPTGLEKNLASMSTLLSTAQSLGTVNLGGKSAKFGALAGTFVLHEAKNDDLVEFLGNYWWLESEYPFPKRPTEAALQIEFLKQQKHGITSWLVVAPQRQKSFGPPVKSTPQLSVKERHRIEGRGFQVIGEPKHRRVAEFLADVDPGESDLTPNNETESLRNPTRGVLLLYPVREEEKQTAAVGFELLFPNNDLPFDLNFTVRRKSAKIVVSE